VTVTLEEIDVDLPDEEIPGALAGLLAEVRDYLVSAGATDRVGQQLIGKVELVLEHWFEEEATVAKKGKKAEEPEPEETSGDETEVAEESGDDTDDADESGDDTSEPCSDCGVEAGQECEDDCPSWDEDDDDEDDEDEEDDED